MSSSDPPPTRSRESIWKRSKRVLGSSHFAFLQETGAEGSRVHDKEADKGDSDGSKPVVSKRREQVRRAQKTHRQRTESYVKALEKEVLRLKAVEAAASKEIQTLRNEVNLLRQNSVQVTTTDASAASLGLGQLSVEDQFMTDWGNDWATITLMDQNGVMALKAETSPPNAFAYTPSTPDPFLQNNPVSTDHYSGSSPDRVAARNHTAYWEQLAAANPLANEQTAINFVLSLEQPCMAHLPDHMTDPDAVDGHILTASETILRQVPADNPAPGTFTADTTGIKALFSLSSSLDLQGEITPVEAWNRIWQHQNAANLRFEDLKALEKELKKLVVCYGFGGVLDEWKFEDAVENVLQGRVPAS